MWTEIIAWVLCIKAEDPQCNASVHLTKDNETKFASESKRSEHKPSARCQPGEHVWSVKDLSKKAEIITTLLFGAQNVPFSCTENLAVCY